MSGLLPSGLLQATREIINQNDLGSLPKLGILRIQEDLETTVRNLESLRTQYGAHTSHYLKRTAELANHLAHYVLPHISQASTHPAVLKVWAKWVELNNSLDKELQQNPDRDDVKKVSLNVEEVLQSIKALEQEIEDALKRTGWPKLRDTNHASLTAKYKTLVIADEYAKLSRFYSDTDQKLDLAEKYWKQALNHFKMYSTYPCGSTNVDYNNWLDLSKHFLFRFHLHVRRILPLTHKDCIILLDQALKAIKLAIDLNKTAEAFYHQSRILQEMKDINQTPPEDPLTAFRTYFDHCKTPMSKEDTKYAQLYAGDLAKNRRLREAREWLCSLLQKHPDPFTYLYLGKIEDDFGNIEEALKNFQAALNIAPNNLEILLWFTRQKVKIILFEMKTATKAPEPKKIQEIVDFAKDFYVAIVRCADLVNEKTSTYISLKRLADHLCVAMFPDISNLLLHLEHYRFALVLNNYLLKSFEKLLYTKFFKSSEKVELLTRIGVIHYFLKEWKKAEECLNSAIQLDVSHLSAYADLVLVYVGMKDEDKLRCLSTDVKKLMEALSDDTQSKGFSDFFFNVGTAFLMLGKEGFAEAQEFYRLSLEQDQDNWRTRIHLARTLVLTNDLEQAHGLLIPYLDTSFSHDNPFGETSHYSFQIYFCISAIFAIKGNTDQASKIAIKVGSTRYDTEETNNLQRYINALRDKSNDRNSIIEEIKTSIRKMGFTCRIGKIINPRSININENEFIGFHGTIDCYLDHFKEGITPQRAEIRQFNGKGFYLTKEREIACYFAMKKAKEEKRGKPILIKVYTGKTLTGKEVDPKHRVTTVIKREYDFVKAVIDGFEEFTQYYVMESSLSKLKLPSPIEKETVEWSDKDYDEFIKKHTRSTMHC